MQKAFLDRDQGHQDLLSQAVLRLPQLRQQHLLNSMMLLDGHQRSIIQTISSPLVGRSQVVERLQVQRMPIHYNLALFGMKHLAIIMMLLLDSIMMEIQDYIMMVTMGFGILMITKLSSMSPTLIRVTIKQLENKMSNQRVTSRTEKGCIQNTGVVLGQSLLE
ncbi:unnamed protein product [Camellia sinensis]